MALTLSTKDSKGHLAPTTFSVMAFPAGEPHVKVAEENVGRGPLTEIASVTGNDPHDLVLLGMWADAARQRGSRTVVLMPYLPGARADRGLPFGAQVYAKVINSLGFDQIICFDPHSPVMPGLLDNLTIVDSTALVRRAVVGRADSDQHPQHYAGIIAPDKGAVTRAQHVADACHLPLFKAEKHRDEATGELSGFTCEQLPNTGKFLIVDDICDGGGTFIGLAETTGVPKERLGLYVSHGVFSGNAYKLADHFSEIWTTDSIAVAPGGTPFSLNYTVIPVGPYLAAAINH